MLERKLYTVEQTCMEHNAKGSKQFPVLDRFLSCTVFMV